MPLAPQPPESPRTARSAGPSAGPSPALRSALDAVGEPVAVFGPEGALQFANARCRTATVDLDPLLGGRPVGEVPWAAVRADGSAMPAAELPVEITRTTGRPASDVVVGLPGSDGPRWIRVSTAPLEAGATPPCAVVATFTDVTAHHTAEAEAADARSRLVATIDALSEGVVFWDAEGRPALRNPAVERLRAALDVEIAEDGSYTPPVLVEADGRVLDESEWPWVLARVQGVATVGRELGFRSPDGDVRWMEISATPLAGGPPDGPHEVSMSLFDVTDRRAQERRLAHLADHDPLTGLLNRRGLSVVLEHHLVEARRYGTEGAVLLFDLDRFKAVNDVLGHDAGDELLERVAGTLVRNVRSGDHVARIGGDEFVVLLPSAGLAGGRVAATKLVAALESALATGATAELGVSASVGIALLAAHDDPGTLLRRADRSMYRAKALGGGRVGTETA